MIHKLIYKYSEPEYEEEFKDIVYPGIKPDMYMISNHGRVYNIKKKIIMKTYFDDDNHEKITLVTNVKHKTRRGNKSKHYFIHRLMLWTFIGPPPDELHDRGCHKNEIPCCNFIHNLEWGSVLENTNHAKKHGKMNNSGMNCKRRKYSEKLIRKICKYRENGLKMHEISEIIFNDNKYTKTQINALVRRVCCKTSFHDIVSDYDFDVPDNIKNCSDEIRVIRNMIINGDTNYDILNFFGYNKPSDNKTFYNKIIEQRAICKGLFNDYRNDSIEEISI